MYVDHPIFTQPEDKYVKVWRYMDFTKLVSLIGSRSLFFTRANKFDDPFEGSWPRTKVLARQNVPDDVPVEGRAAYLKATVNLEEINKQWPKYNAINCWHMNDHESAAMWKLYLKSNEGIAVQSTYNKLRASITDDEEVCLGVVKYIDYETEWIDASNLLSPFVHKRKSFGHEREVRAVVTKWPPTGDDKMDFTQETIGHGLKIKVDIECLIERIHIAPGAPNWFADLMKALVQRYGYNFEIVHSKLNESPLF